ncbi:MAG: hypothetical protein IPL79_17115 [Myxococcales bacterium]|nr:hypothetical protein [Myxococcales bacterium]
MSSRARVGGATPGAAASWPVWLVGCLLTLAGSLGATPAAADTEVKPYVLLIVDTSGSMGSSTNAGVASCPGSSSSKLDHAKCAIQRVAYSYAEMILGLGIYRQAPTGSGNQTCGNAPNTQSCPSKNVVCNANGNLGDSLDVLVPLYDGNTGGVVSFNNMSCSGGCTNGAADPEIIASGGTPIGGSIVGAKRYYQGLDSPNFGPYATGLGADPIRNDPLKNVFVGGEQCRPYLVIQLTDGGETCGGSAPAAATSLLTTVVDGLTYRIETRAIGFGIAAGDAAIEALAQAGGRPNVPGENEGYYAANEEELQIAISDIVAESIKYELCNGADDDCDTLIDEDFTNLGDACFDNGIGVCRGSGVLVCNAGETGTTCQVTNPGDSPSTEICDGLDNDCDTLIDEGNVCGGCTNVEVCNNLDDDCDGVVDDNLTRTCGSDVGVCVKGTETCVAGVWVGCDDVGPQTEICDSLDNNCDGLTDGFAQSCSDLPGGNPNIGICHPGTQICPANGDGNFLPCTGEVVPQTEVCDLLDNDCDGFVDEDTGGNACDAACGVGVTVCVAGQIQCPDGQAGVETCNGFDDDCDGVIDDGTFGGGACNQGGTICNGVLECLNGGLVCEGPPVGVEICNCEDDDCDGSIDENPGSLCSGGSQCVQCECAFVCAPGEFPCPLGRSCIDGFCITDLCFDVVCEPLPGGDATTCVEGTCLRACDITPCSAGTVCVPELGECRFDDCRTFPERCDATDTCVAGECIDNPCAGVTCEGGEYCSGGDCVDSCAGVACGTGRRCELGVCVEDPCGGPCITGEVCNAAAGVCVGNLCAEGFMCDVGLACNPLNGLCEPDVCATVACPSEEQVCVQGSCYFPADVAPASQRVTVAGKGCSAQTGAGAGWLLLALAALTLQRRRRAAKEVA